MDAKPIEEFLSKKTFSKELLLEAIDVVFNTTNPSDMSIYAKMSSVCNELDNKDLNDSFTSKVLVLHTDWYNDRKYSDIYLSLDIIDSKYVTHKEISELISMSATVVE